jgi:hypothetical protein
VTLCRINFDDGDIVFFQPFCVILQPIIVELERGAHKLVSMPGDAGEASRLHVLGVTTAVAFATLKSNFLLEGLSHMTVSNN